jgi:hypothetical protein
MKTSDLRGIFVSFKAFFADNSHAIDKENNAERGKKTRQRRAFSFVNTGS